MEDIEIIYRDNEVTTLQSLYSDNGISFDSVEDWLSYKDNKLRIYNSYNDLDRRTYPTVNNVNINHIRGYVVLLCPKNRIRRDFYVYQTTQVVGSVNQPTFIDDNIKNIILDDGYRPVNIQKTDKKLGNNRGDLYRKINNVRVLIWCKSVNLNYDGEKITEGSTFFDLTPFIISLETNVDANGGNFSLVLPPIGCVCDLKGWRIDSNSFTQFKNSSEFLDRTTIHKVVDNEALQINPLNRFQTNKNFSKSEIHRRNTFLFHKLISSNDLVFIAFEKLGNDSSRGDFITETGDMRVDGLNVANGIWDMIGLVDNNSISYSPQGSEMTISIQGRDLIKPLIEDGEYFYPLEFYSNNEKGLFSLQNDSELGSPVKRLINGSMSIFTAYIDKTIEDAMKFTLNALSNVKIVPNNLFNPWETTDKKVLSRRYLLKDNSIYNRESMVKNQNSFRLKLAEPKKQTDIDDILTTNVSNDNVNFSLFSSNSINDILNNKLGDDKLSIINLDEVERRLKDNSGINIVKLKEIYKLEDLEIFSIQATPTQFENSPLRDSDVQQSKMDGIWQIIKLHIDESSTRRRLVDSSVTTTQGSLMNYIQKICQKPLVEFYGDTYGNLYYYFVRKPPYDYEGFNSNFILDITESEIYSENLSFDDSEAYSWYRLTPQGEFFGQGQKVALAEFPAFHFKEYADLWGNKPLDVVSNYINYKSTIDAEKRGVNLDYLREQSIADLRYIIESHAYLPFVRKGIITIRGDRRFKRGMNVRHMGTGEIFHIESVQQNYDVNISSNERTTTLTVNRGMIEAKIDWYFGIIDFEEKEIEIPAPPFKEQPNFVLDVHFDSDKHTLINTSITSENATQYLFSPGKTPVNADASDSINRQTYEDILENNENRLNLARRSDEAIRDLAQKLKDFQDMEIEIQGHTDSDASFEYNKSLSLRRANTIKKILVFDYGIDPKRITANGYGEIRPVAFGSNDNEVDLGNIPGITEEEYNRLVVEKSGVNDINSVNVLKAEQNPIQKSLNRRIEVRILKQPKINNKKPEKKKILDWKVNTPVFLALLKKKQFCLSWNDDLSKAADSIVREQRMRKNKGVSVTDSRNLKDFKNSSNNFA